MGILFSVSKTKGSGSETMQRARSIDTSVLNRSLAVPFALVFKGLFAVLQTHASKYRALILAIELQCTVPTI